MLNLIKNLYFLFLKFRFSKEAKHKLGVQNTPGPKYDVEVYSATETKGKIF